MTRVWISLFLSIKCDLFCLLFLQNDKKSQLEGKLKDVRFRLSNQRKEVEQTNQTRETRITEITLLQQQLQVRQAKKTSS